MALEGITQGAVGDIAGLFFGKCGDVAVLAAHVKNGVAQTLEHLMFLLRGVAGRVDGDGGAAAGMGTLSLDAYRDWDRGKMRQVGVADAVLQLHSIVGVNVLALRTGEHDILDMVPRRRSSPEGQLCR